MKQPYGFSDYTSRVCRLNRNVYGLKEASRRWNERFVNFLRKYKFQATDVDCCIFIHAD